LAEGSKASSGFGGALVDCSSARGTCAENLDGVIDIGEVELTGDVGRPALYGRSLDLFGVAALAAHQMVVMRRGCLAAVAVGRLAIGETG